MFYENILTFYMDFGTKLAVFTAMTMGENSWLKREGISGLIWLAITAGEQYRLIRVERGQYLIQANCTRHKNGI